MTSPGLNSLVVFDSLKIGPARIEPRRIRADYELIPASGKAERNELIYSYEEDVFDDSPESVNLASMILSQVALNYGLFCRKLVFDGLFDDTDKRFLLDMLENTSREIYVNKFLFPNEFLKPPFDKIQAIPQKQYTTARVSFKNSRYGKYICRWEHRDTRKNSYMILSSGGKDSLLTYGLLKELSRETHPVFINESGRHWFSAINAYKHLSETEPNTARVWCNSDRIFNWMLRFMPFIREDFLKVRADIYPVRIYTVAVFLFGVLPLARKTGAGNILIGDEYDTSMKSSYRGITHYEGLYDQSRYFDRALTRYYTKKGWNTCQFSILRGLSEMLIEKILAKRYPDLQKHQVSCHAAHLEGDRAFPCGKCEKCRRIVAMLKVLGESPLDCGYTDAQVKHALAMIGSRGVKQFDTDAAHLYHLLLEKELIGRNGNYTRLAKAQPQIMKVRFDRDRNKLNEIPKALLQQLLPLYLQYADGVVMKKNRQWTDFDFPAELEKSPPYPFEVLAPGREETSAGTSYRWEFNTWMEIEERLKEVDTVILPCGSIEQHGPHLPLDVDYFDSVYLAERVAEACSHPKPFVLPGIPYGVAYHHEDFKGTISISNHTLSSLVYDIGMSLARNGVAKLIILNAHGDNAPTLLYSAQMINRDSGIFVCVESGESSDPDIYRLIDTPNDIHAGEIETSTTLALRPEMVQMDRAVNETMDFGSSYLDFTSERGVAWYVRTKIISKSGIMGDPTKASSEKGKKIWEIMIAHLVRFVEEVKKSRLEDLYQRKY
jgi:creatinine amidohydrolase/Fe(II)-dependent formamide hydrolase-like protein